MTLSSTSSGSRVRFPLPPAEGESFQGFVARVAAHNLYPDLGGYLAKAGLAAADPDSLHRGIGVLAEIFGQSPEAISRLIPKPAGKGMVQVAGRVMFGGAILTDRRRIAPVVLRERGVDLAEWGLRARPVCMESWAILRDTCPNDACAVRLDWQSTSLFTCLRCGNDFRKARTSYIREEHRGLLALGFPTSEDTWRKTAREYLPPDLSEMPFELCRELFGAISLAMRECKNSPKWPDALPSSYPSGVLEGCHALACPEHLRRIAAGEFGRNDANGLRAKLRALSAGNAPLQEAIRLATGIRSLTEIDQERSITAVAAKLKIPRSKLRDLVRVGGIGAVPIMGGDKRRYDEVKVDELNSFVADRVSISSLAKSFKLKDRYILSLASAGELKRLTGLAAKIYSEAQLSRSQAISYLSDLEEKVFRHGEDEQRILLAEVMARLPPGPKPWGNIVAAAAEGSLEGGLGSLAPTGLDATRLTLSNAFASQLISGSIDIERPLWPCDPEAGFGLVNCIYASTSLSEAEEALGLYPRDMQALLKLGYLDVRDGHVTWASIQRCAKQVIGTRELAARAEIEPLNLGVEAAKRGLARLAPRAGVWSRVRALAVFDLPRNPSDRFNPPKPGLSVRLGL
jgi:hypothetical protein